MLPSAAPGNEMFVLVGIAMVMMGGAGAQAAYRPLVYVFTLTITIVFVLGLARFLDAFHLLYGIAFMLVCFVTIMSSRNQERALHEQILFRLERDELTRLAQEAREQSENARQEAENARGEAERANRSKTVFLTAASHDLRQPMHALVQYVDYLKKHNEDRHLGRWIERSERAIDALRTLLDSMLDISRIALGKIKPTISPTRMKTVLERLDAQARPHATDKGLYFEVERTEAWVNTDVGLLERILVNLTLNAIRYTRSGRVVVRCSKRGQYLRCHVFDSGIGIPPEELKNIYEPFYQVENAARDRRKGLGMGLAIVRQLCDLMNHPIRVRSVPGKGSVFAVDLPIVASETTTTRATEEPSDPPRDFVRGAFIVLVDNDAEDLEATAHTLRDFGCRVLCGASSQSVLAKLQGKEVPPDLILADYRLENETGLDAIRILSDNLRAAFGEDFWIPALIISGDTSTDVLAEVRNDGYPMLHKPVPSQELGRAINGLLEAKSWEETH